MARAGRPKYTPEELERLRTSVVRNGDTSYIPREVYRQIERDRPGGRRFPGYTQPGGGPDKFNPGGRDRGSDLARYQELIGRLERSRGRRGGTTTRRPADLVDRRGKTRKSRDSGNSRSYEERKAEADRRQAEYNANQARYRADFEIPGGFRPDVAYSQVVTGYYNPETGATWSAPHSGYRPKEGTGWVKGYGPKNDAASNKPVASAKETPTKGNKFEAMLRGRMRKF